MSPIEIDLPEIEREQLADCTTAGGYANPSEYVQQLIRADHEIRQSLHAVTANPTAEALVIEGLESGNAGEFTPDDWDDLRAPHQPQIESREG